MKLHYWRTFEASEGVLAFNSDTEPRRAGRVQYRVTNFLRPEVDVYQIQDDSIVAKLVNGRLERKDGTFQLTFEDSGTSPTGYFAVEREQYDQVDHIAPAKPSVISNPGNQADYIIISHSDFIDGIQPLAAFRRSQGLSVMVVDVDEVYDQFNDGIFNPLAIQKFLRHTYIHWRAPKPTYVLLVGDAPLRLQRSNCQALSGGTQQRLRSLPNLRANVSRLGTGEWRNRDGPPFCYCQW